MAREFSVQRNNSRLQQEREAVVTGSDKRLELAKRPPHLLLDGLHVAIGVESRTRLPKRGKGLLGS